MTSKKKLDDLELVFIDKPWEKKELKEFRALLKLRKAQRKKKQSRTATSTRKKVTA